jgi:hypothetical protein
MSFARPGVKTDNNYTKFSGSKYNIEGGGAKQNKKLNIFK